MICESIEMYTGNVLMVWTIKGWSVTILLFRSTVRRKKKGICENPCSKQCYCELAVW